MTKLHPSIIRTQCREKTLLSLRQIYNRTLSEGVKPEEQRLLDALK